MANTGTQGGAPALFTPESSRWRCREATRGGYETVDASADALHRPYTALAALLHCSPDELAIVSSATAAWQQVIYGLAWTWRPGDRVRACPVE